VVGSSIDVSQILGLFRHSSISMADLTISLNGSDALNSSVQTNFHPMLVLNH